jgi:hypothetical protein
MDTLLQTSAGRRGPGHDDINLERYQFRCQLGKTAHLSFVRSELKPYILPLDVTQVAQHLGKQLPKSLRTRSATHQDANGSHLELLRPRRDRPSCRAAEKRDELAPFQLIKWHPSPGSPRGCAA